MTDAKTNNKDCASGSCPVDKKDGGKLVKITDLPLVGNPYPPKDAIENDEPGSLELAVKSLRTSIQPYISPVCVAYQKASDVMSIGIAHSQSAIENLWENQNHVRNTLIISGAGVLGFAIARRRGIIKRLLLTSMLMTGASVICYPKDAKEKAAIALLMAKNQMSNLAQGQYGSSMTSKLSSKHDKADSITKDDQKTSDS